MVVFTFVDGLLDLDLPLRLWKENTLYIIITKVSKAYKFIIIKDKKSYIQYKDIKN